MNFPTCSCGSLTMCRLVGIVNDMPVLAVVVEFVVFDVVGMNSTSGRATGWIVSNVWLDVLLVLPDWPVEAAGGRMTDGMGTGGGWARLTDTPLMVLLVVLIVLASTWWGRNEDEQSEKHNRSEGILIPMSRRRTLWRGVMKEVGISHARH